MPNAKVLESKKAVVAALVEQLKNAQSGVLVDYSGITVAEDTELRAKLREGEVKYGVVKNNMVRRALDESGLQELDSVLEGTTSLATGEEDPIAPIRIIACLLYTSGLSLRRLLFGRGLRVRSGAVAVFRLLRGMGLRRAGRVRRPVRPVRHPAHPSGADVRRPGAG